MRFWLASFLLCAAVRPDAPPGHDDALLAHLNDAVAWYRRLAAQARFVNEPSDVMFIEQDRQLARQALAQAFDGARGLAIMDAQTAPAGSQQQKTPAAPQQPLSKRAADAAAAVQKTQADLDAAQRDLAAARTGDRAALEQQVAAEHSAVALAQVRAQTLKSISEFSSQVGAGGTGLAGQIDELERSVPEVRSQQPPPAQVAPAAAPRGSQGAIGLLEELFALIRKEREIHASIAQSVALRAGNEKLRAPLATTMRGLLQQADQLTAPDPGGDPAERKKQLDDLTVQFRKLSDALLPLGKEAVLIDAVRADLSQWDSVNDSSYGAVLRSLALRAGLLLTLIMALLATSELWRRATFRYVRDPRRREVSLLVRRIVVAVVAATAIVFSLVNEAGSLATFAGFITAGLAVALQNVILSMAAYFFLIGKYGLRVGERVQIGTVIGDVLEIGFVRLHVMETGPDGLPSGRVVVFSNSVVFQGPNLFKPLPGTNFAWHEMKLTLAAQADRALAEQQVLAAVQGVVDSYRVSIEQQHAEVQGEVQIKLQAPKPHLRLRLTEAGLEMLVRYPVPLDAAAAVDDKVTRALLAAIEHEPHLRFVGATSASLQPAP